MSIETYLTFVAACIVLVAMPGPNVALIVATSLGAGRRAGLATVAGTSSAMAVQLALVVAGLSGLLGIAAASFEWLRWLGVAYLAYLGVTALCSNAKPAPVDSSAALTSAMTAWRGPFLRGFLVSLTNPKTLLFQAAFLPQFVSFAGDMTTDLALLALTFLAIAVTLDSVWALLAARAGRFLAFDARRLSQLTGGLLLAAAAGLALARRPL
jgi:threonine/homoserine/homoserine lactone efflux protein